MDWRSQPQRWSQERLDRRLRGVDRRQDPLGHPGDDHPAVAPADERDVGQLLERENVGDVGDVGVEVDRRVGRGGRGRRFVPKVRGGQLSTRRLSVGRRGWTITPSPRTACVAVLRCCTGRGSRLGRARLVVGHGHLFPIRPAARTELVSLALVVVVRLPIVEVKQAPQRPHVISIARRPAWGYLATQSVSRATQTAHVDRRMNCVPTESSVSSASFGDHPLSRSSDRRPPGASPCPSRSPLQ